MTDTYDLPPTQALLLEVLAARHRLGEHLWTFPATLTAAARALAGRGLVGWKSGVAPRTIMVWLTDAGRDECLLDGYEPAPVRAERERIAGLLRERGHGAAADLVEAA